MQADSIPVVILTGTVGVGKTSVAFEMSEILAARAVPHALVDLDALSHVFPRPPDDPYGQRVALENLAAVWRNNQQAGARQLILVRVIEASPSLTSIEPPSRGLTSPSATSSRPPARLPRASECGRSAPGWTGTYSEAPSSTTSSTRRPLRTSPFETPTEGSASSHKRSSSPSGGDRLRSDVQP